MLLKFTDWRGNNWGEGDTIVYVTVGGNTPTFNEAEVLSIEVTNGYYREEYKIKVQPLRSSASYRCGERKPVTLTQPLNVMKI